MLFCVYFVSFLKKGSGSSQQEPTSSFRGWCETKRRSARCRCRVQHYLLFNPHVRAWQMAVVWWGSWCRKVESWRSFQVFYSAASFTWVNLKKVSTALIVRIDGMVGSVTTPLLGIVPPLPVWAFKHGPREDHPIAKARVIQLLFLSYDGEMIECYKHLYSIGSHFIFFYWWVYPGNQYATACDQGLSAETCNASGKYILRKKWVVFVYCLPGDLRKVMKINIALHSFCIHCIRDAFIYVLAEFVR